MTGQCNEFALLDDESIERISELEEEIGVNIMALTPTCTWAALSEEALSKLQDTERELGVILLAYDEAA